MADKKVETISPARQNDEIDSVTAGKVDHVVEDIVHAAEEEFSPEQYRKLLAKVDRIMLPMMWVSQTIQGEPPLGLWDIVMLAWRK